MGSTLLEQVAKIAADRAAGNDVDDGMNDPANDASVVPDIDDEEIDTGDDDGTDAENLDSGDKRDETPVAESDDKEVQGQKTVADEHIPAKDASEPDNSVTADEKPQDKAAEVNPEEEELDLSIKLDPEIYDPEFIDGINKHNEKVKGVINALRQDVRTLREARDQERGAAFEAEFDGMISGLDEGFTEILGKEPGHALKQDDAKMQNRVKVITLMTSIAEAKKQSGEKFTMKGLFEAAIAAAFTKEQKQIAASNLRKNVQKQERLLINKSTNVKQTLSPKRSAVQAVAEKLEKLGINSQGGDEEDDEG